MSKPLRINGELIPENKRGRKVKLYELMSMAEIEERLAATKATDKRTPEQLEKSLEKIREKERPVLKERRQQKMKDLNKNQNAKTRKERGLE